MAVATDNDGDHYCLFAKRLDGAWEVMSIGKQQTMVVSDLQFEVLVKTRKFRLFQKRA